MKRKFHWVSFLFLAVSLVGITNGNAATNDATRVLIDLPTVLRLAGAKNLEVEIARERLKEARAARQGADFRFVPVLTPGLSYRAHENLIQDVTGKVVDAHKDSFLGGASVSAGIEIGESVFDSLASRQLEQAAASSLESVRQGAVLAAAAGYFDLAHAHEVVVIARDTLAITTNYAGQVKEALDAGIAFRGDLLRVQAQSERERVALRQAEEGVAMASANLLRILHLGGRTELLPLDVPLAPLQVAWNLPALDGLVAQALSLRPELKENRARLAAAENRRDAARLGPLIPRVSGDYFAGGLRGSSAAGPTRSGETEDFGVSLGWRLGPGGLFDLSRIRGADSRRRQLVLGRDQLVDEITFQVVEASVRLNSLRDQIDGLRKVVQNAVESLELSRQRKQFSVGAVLEVILAEQDVARARLGLALAVAELNKAYYTLRHATGSALSEGLSPAGRP